MINTQKPQPIDRKPKGQLQVHSIFSTLQGEGPLVGTPALFIRLHGCNLQCPQCDTDYTSANTTYAVKDLLDEVSEQGPQNLVVITGGEPFRQNLCPLLKALRSRWPKTVIQIETNGSFFTQEDAQYFASLDHEHRPQIVCSPKLDRLAPLIKPYVTAYKYVGRAGHLAQDGLPKQALGHPIKIRLYRPPMQRRTHLRNHGQIFLQPEDSGRQADNDRNLRACLDSCRKFGWRLSLQTHKWLGLS